MADQYDLIIIGSGPGGYVAAIRAAQLGLKVAVVEQDSKFGGTCLHRGCIPTKALLHTAELYEQIKEAGEMGIALDNPRLDMAAAHRRKQQVVDKNAKGIEFLFKKNKVDGLHGRGRISGANEVTVEDGENAGTYRAEHIVIATGSVPRELPIAPYDGERILSSDHILKLEQVPESLVVLGAGAVGTEFASMYASFGSEVTLIEMLPRVLPIEDEDCSKELARMLKKRGISIMTDTKMNAVATGGSGVEIQVKQGEKESSLSADALLVAVGRAPVTESLGLAELGIELDKGYVPVNDRMQTSVPHIYAIGDVVQTPWLAHVASAEGILAVEHIAGEETRPIDYDRIPSCTYCEPEVASVGLTEAAAKERGYEVATGKFPFSALAKAAIAGKTGGFVKVVRETRYDQLLGVHIVGAHATDLIAEACVALAIESTNEELVRTIHAHPTMAEAVAEAAHAAAGHAIHI